MNAVVDSAWLAEHLDEEDLVVGDVRGPNAHMRGHIPGSRPLVLGSPPPAADEESARELAREIALRLRRHGITGRERLVLVDRGDGIGAMPAAQMAELAGHPQRLDPARRDGSVAGRARRGSGGARATSARRELEPNPHALPTRQELAGRLGDSSLTLLDVRTPEEFSGRRGNQCDPRQGHIPGARNLEVGALFEAPGRPAPPEQIRELVGLPDGAEVVAYCHSGSRSAIATLALRSAGYDARNYAGSWHEWSRHDELPLER